MVERFFYRLCRQVQLFGILKQKAKFYVLMLDVIGKFALVVAHRFVACNQNEIEHSDY